MNPENWKPTSTTLLSSRKDPEDLRWSDLAAFCQSPAYETKHVYASDGKNPSHDPVNVGVWGYADDEGISLNGGRVGAQFAPDGIRRFFYRLTPPLLSTQNTFRINDYGNWLKGKSLLAQIEEISPVLFQQLQHHPMITLGGGHDYGAVDGAGFLQWCSNQKSQKNPSLPASQRQEIKPFIINFDAHLDVRPWKKSGLNSGTPFSWLIDHYSNQFHFTEVGIQDHCSSPHHRQWLESKGFEIISLDYLRNVGMTTALRQAFAGTSTQQPCYISLDIDVLSQSYAPGCSQSWDAGLTYAEIEAALRWLMTNKNVRLLGIYEVSPPLDWDHKTSKLASCLMDTFIKNFWTNS